MGVRVASDTTECRPERLTAQRAGKKRALRAQHTAQLTQSQNGPQRVHSSISTALEAPVGPQRCGATYLGVAAERVLQQVRQLRVPVPDVVSPPRVCAQSARLTPPHPPPQKPGPHDISGLRDAMGTVLDASLTTASGGRADCVLCARDVRIARRQRVDHVTKRLHRSIAMWCAPVLATSANARAINENALAVPYITYEWHKTDYK